MIRFDDLPSAAASTERLADWIEFRVLTSAAHSVSRAELMSDLQISGSEDALGDSGDEDVPGDNADASTLEGIVDSVFTELDDRLIATGGDSGTYPYALSENALALRTGMEVGIYTFLIMVAFWSDENDSFFREGVKIFEDISAEAARAYIGATKTPGEAVVFGFPRKVRIPGHVNRRSGKW